MTPPGRLAVVAGAAAVLALLLGGCGAYDEANSHNQPITTGTPDLRLSWQRVDSPPNYPTIVFACHGADGIYIAQDSGTTAFVVPDDPECAR